MEGLSSSMIQHEKKYHRDAETMKTPCPVADEKMAIFHRPSVRFSTLSMMSVRLSGRPSNLKYDQVVCKLLLGTQDIV
jgi:hypothetical protein